jgi:hypothetical protein
VALRPVLPHPRPGESGLITLAAYNVLRAFVSQSGRLPVNWPAQAARPAQPAMAGRPRRLAALRDAHQEASAPPG